MSVSAWDLDLSGHNHRHRCRQCDAIIWHVGTKAECDLLDPLCVDCLDELVRSEEGTL